MQITLWADANALSPGQDRSMTTMRNIPQTSVEHRLGANVATIAIAAGCLLGLCAGFAALAATVLDGMLDFFLPG